VWECGSQRGLHVGAIANWIGAFQYADVSESGFCQLYKIEQREVLQVYRMRRGTGGKSGIVWPGLAWTASVISPYNSAKFSTVLQEKSLGGVHPLAHTNKFRANKQKSEVSG
jgi:hypothetical protein